MSALLDDETLTRLLTGAAASFEIRQDGADLALRKVADAPKPLVAIQAPPAPGGGGCGGGRPGRPDPVRPGRRCGYVRSQRARGGLHEPGSCVG